LLRQKYGSSDWASATTDFDSGSLSVPGILFDAIPLRRLAAAGARLNAPKLKSDDEWIQ
jgi:hypothetical protein